MSVLIESVMMLFILSDMAILALSRLNTCIAVAALQGILLGAFVLLSNADSLSVRLVALAIVSIALKGIAYPFLMKRAIKESEARYEDAPIVGFGLSIAAGMAMLLVSSWLGARLHLKAGADLPFVVPGAFMTLFTGLFLVVARRKALSQCLGYVIFENGIYAFGLAAVGEVPALVELGILLDAFVAVLVMGIAIYRINRTFDHMDADRLSSLKG
jgi:hydrogenase-4 component E